ncbi:MAG: SDR family oxidoreductase [Planctomycetes bacterium]|nr:SDR family oxidoreductase [Planctomycetota bacterium]
MTTAIRGKVAIVTGGAVRLGREIALGLSDAGAGVVVHYGRSREAAERTICEIAAAGGRAVAVEADLASPVEAACAIIGAARAEFGRVDILVNNASVFEPSTLADAEPDDWDRQFAVNLKAPFYLCREFAGAREPGRRAHIVNILDWRATRPGAGHLVYTLTKAALATLTLALAQELAPDVQVNAVAPGAILPPPGEGADYLDKLSTRIPLGRTGNAADVAEAVLFLLRSEFITGEILHVTGGQEL